MLGVAARQGRSGHHGPSVCLPQRPLYPALRNQRLGAPPLIGNPATLLPCSRGLGGQRLPPEAHLHARPRPLGPALEVPEPPDGEPWIVWIGNSAVVVLCGGARGAVPCCGLLRHVTAVLCRAGAAACEGLWWSTCPGLGVDILQC